MGPSSKKRKIVAVLTITVLSVLIIVFLAGPRITGFTISRTSTINSLEVQVSELNKKLTTAEEDMNAEKTSHEETLSKLTTSEEKVTSMESTNSDLLQQISSKNSAIQSIQDDLDDKENELEDFKEGNNELIKSAASSICCIQKQLTNKNIGYYEVNGDDIICKDSGEDNKQIECF